MRTMRRWWGHFWVRRVTFAVVALAPALTWRRWLPALLGLAPILAPYGDALAAVGPLADWVFGAISFLAGSLFPRRSPAEPTLLLWSSPEEEIARRSDRGKTPWAPRTPNHGSFLANHPRFCFRDAAGAGKTREALEVIRCTSGKPMRGLITPNWGARFESATRQQLEEALDRLKLGDGPVALWLDDLHQPPKVRSRAQVVDLLETLEKRLNGGLIVAATSRQDAGLEEWRDCLDRHGIAVLSLAALERATLRRLADDMAKTEGVTLSDAAHDAFWASNDHRPELALAALRRLAADGIAEPRAEQLADRLRRGMSDLWQDERKKLVGAHNGVEPLLEALSLFYAAGQSPDARLVRAVALQRARGWRQRIALRLGGAEAALLSHPYFGRRGNRLIGAEVALEAAWQTEDAARELELFVARHRRLLQRRPLQRLNDLREAQSWLAVGLGNRLHFAERDSDQAAELYALALRIQPDKHEAANNWGNSLADKALLLASQRRPEEALAASEAACERYAQALFIQPTTHHATHNLGAALAEKARLLVSLGRTAGALAACDAAGERFDQALRIRPDNHQAAYAWGAALTGKARLLASLDRTEEALAAFGAAGERFDQALRIRPDNHEAAYNWAATLVDRAHLLASLGRPDEALAAYGAAGERYAHALRILPTMHEAANNWGSSVDDKARLLASLGRTEEALAAYGAAEGLYEFALRIEPDKHEAANNWGAALGGKAELLASLGRTEEALAAYEAAEGRFELAMRIHPDMHWAADNWGNALLLKAGLLASLGRTEEALAAYEAAEGRFELAMQIQPDKYETAYAWGNSLAGKAVLLASLGRPHEALAAYEAACERYAQALCIKTDMHDATNNWGVALAAKAALLASLGRPGEALAAYEAAAERYADALRIQPGMHEAANNWGVALGAQGDLFVSLGIPDQALAAYEAAEQLFGLALETQPDDHSMANNLGAALGRKAMLLESLERKAEALDAYESACERYAHALRIHPERHETANNLGIALTRKANLLASLGRPGEALEAYEAAKGRFELVLERQVDDSSAQLSLCLTLEQMGWVLASAESWLEAIRALERADADLNALAPEGPLQGWRQYLRWFILRHAGDPASAQHLESAMAVGVEQVNLDGAVEDHFNLGLFLLADGQRAEGLASYQRGLDMEAPPFSIAQACIELRALGALLGPEAVAEALALLGSEPQ